MTITKEEEKAFALHEEWAIKAVYEKCFPLLKYTAFEIVQDEAEAEDIAAETILAALEKAEVDKGTLLGFLLKICKNKAVDALRRRNKIVEMDDKNEEPVSVESGYGHSELLGKIATLLDEEEYRIFIYVTLFDFKLREVAALLSLPLSTVKTKYYRSIRYLRKNLKREGF